MWERKNANPTKGYSMILKLGIFLVAVGLIKLVVSFVMRHKKREDQIGKRK